jgi:type 1 fimbriae regulatory protein FimB/type 1 fimbriae regulatory protein FimE
MLRFLEMTGAAPMTILSNKRKHLSTNEVELLLKTCSDHRNRTMVLLAYRHGLRVSELIGLEWNAIDLVTGSISLTRMKNGIPSNHPLTGQELRALRRLKRDNPNCRHVFLSNRKTPMTRQNVNAFLADLGKEAGFDFPVTPHMLRHSCGTKLANDGRDTRSIQHYLGHRNIQSTVVYTHMNANRFNGWFRD